MENSRRWKYVISLIVAGAAAYGFLSWWPLLRTMVPLRVSLPFKSSSVTMDDDIDGGRRLFLLDRAMLDDARAKKNEPSVALPLARLVKDANRALGTAPVSVMDKTGVPPGGDKHDFWTLSPYFWPNTILPGGKPYWYRDGRVNPESNEDKYDRRSFFIFMDAVETLSLAYFFTGDERYARHCAGLLRVWFLDPATAMNPNLRYAQSIPGIADGCNWGMIRCRQLVSCIDASRLITPSPSWTAQDRTGLKAWFRRFINWTAEHPFGLKEYRKPNNHGLWFDASIAAMARFTGDDQTARAVLSRSGELRFDHTIEPDGSQPYELARSLSLHYAIFALEALMAIARNAEADGIDYWTRVGPKGQSLASALLWFSPCVRDGQWKYRQIRSANEWARLWGVLRLAAKKIPSQKLPDPGALEGKVPADHRMRLLYR